jgi:hypothetical protein
MRREKYFFEGKAKLFIPERWPGKQHKKAPVESRGNNVL